MNKQFHVFGEPLEVVVSSEQTDNRFTVIVQTSLAKGGPPPHVHQHEDEIFTVLEGEYEFFDGRQWNPLRRGESIFAPKGKPHAFRRSSETQGRIQGVAISNNRFDQYLEDISALTLPQDLDALKHVSNAYGIVFLGPNQPATL